MRMHTNLTHWNNVVYILSSKKTPTGIETHDLKYQMKKISAKAVYFTVNQET